MRSASSRHLAALALLAAGCTTAVLEPAPAYVDCAFDLTLWSRAAQISATIELGRMNGEVFEPLASGAPLEIAPWPGEGVGPASWYAEVALRIPSPPLADAAPCLQVSQSPYNATLHPDRGTPMRRLANGDLVVDALPLLVGLGVRENSSFLDTLGKPHQISVSGWLAGQDVLVDVVQQLEVVLVNEVGWLAARREETPDAGPAPAPDAGPVAPASFTASLLIRQPRLHVGEQSALQLTINGPRGGEYVTFAKWFVPGTGVLLDRNELDPTLSDDAARTTDGTLGVLGDAIPGEYELKITASTPGGYSVDAVAPFTILPPE